MREGLRGPSEDWWSTLFDKLDTETNPLHLPSEGMGRVRFLRRILPPPFSREGIVVYLYGTSRVGTGGLAVFYRRPFPS